MEKAFFNNLDHYLAYLAGTSADYPDPTNKLEERMYALCERGFGGEHRDFTTNPIDLVNEVAGKLGISNIDVDSLCTLLTINDTYKTLTTNNEAFGTHGAKALYDELVKDIGDKGNATDLTAHTNDTDIHVTSAERTKWDKVTDKVDKTDITTVIDSATTNFIKTYTSLAELGLTDGSETIEDIAKNMKDFTKLIIHIEGNFSNVSIYPYQNGTLIVERLNIHRVHFKFCRDSSTEVYVGTYHGISGFTGWARVCTTSVADVSETKINIINGIENPVCNYQVKNGICYIRLNSGEYSLSENANGLQLATGLPIPLSGQVTHTYIPWGSGDVSKQVIIFVDGVGNLRLHAPDSVNRCLVFTSFSYPVAES